MAHRGLFLDPNVAKAISAHWNTPVEQSVLLDKNRIRNFSPLFAEFEDRYLEAVADVFNEKFVKPTEKYRVSSAWPLTLPLPMAVPGIAEFLFPLFGAASAVSVDVLLETGLRKEFGGIEEHLAAVERAQGRTLVFEIDRNPMAVVQIRGEVSPTTTTASTTPSASPEDPDPLATWIRRVNDFLRKARGNNKKRAKTLLKELRTLQREIKTGRKLSKDEVRSWRQRVSITCRNHTTRSPRALKRAEAIQKMKANPLLQAEIELREEKLQALQTKITNARVKGLFRSYLNELLNKPQRALQNPKTFHSTTAWQKWDAQLEQLERDLPQIIPIVEAECRDFYESTEGREPLTSARLALIVARKMK